MARSVSVPSGAVTVAYAALPEGMEYGDFDFSVECFQDRLREKYPSLENCNSWIGREDRAVLENQFCFVTVSEYCGLVAVAVVPKECDFPGLQDRFLSQIELKNAVGAFGPALVKTGSASNGEAFFQPVDGEQRGDMGLGYTSKEGWL